MQNLQPLPTLGAAPIPVNRPMRYPATLPLALLLACWPLPRARAEVRSVTLGITLNCPYGLAG